MALTRSVALPFANRMNVWPRSILCFAFRGDLDNASLSGWSIRLLRGFRALVTAPLHDRLVHKQAIVVEVDTAKREREQAPGSGERFDDEGAVAHEHRQALGPAGREEAVS
jgi:hypothetical protein